MTNAGNTTTAPNVYQGIVSGNTVSFFGVPIVPPSTTSTRTFRITNVRFNASAGSTGAVIGSLTVQGGNGAGGSGAALISLNQTQATLATVQAGLSTTGTKWTAAVPGLTNCAALSYAYAGTVSFTENFASAFKTRQQPAAGTTAATAQNGSSLTQVKPGSYFSESGLEMTLNNGGITTAGLADFGTRLKAVFNNIPSGASVFVSFTNTLSATNAAAGGSPATYIGAATTDNPGDSAVTSFAELINGAENVVDGTSAPVATPSTSTAVVGPAPAGTMYVPLTVSNGSATAVWEVLNDNPAATETFTFNVWVSLPAQGTTGTATVNLGFAPTATATTIPSFQDTSTAANSIVVSQCKTILLFPYVTSAGGFDTGLAVANTTTDVYGTTAQTGTCQLTLYGTPTPIPTVPVSPTVASGTVTTWLLSQVAPGFTGYAIAVCNFQYAHGFAFVADWTSTIQSSAMGYLAPVLSGGPTRGAAAPEAVTF